MKKNGLSIILLLLLGAIAFYLFKKNSGDASSKVLNDFAIEDTASITQLFLADNDGNHSLLRKMEDGSWMVNDKYKARTKNVYLILRGLHNFEVKSTVPEDAVPAIITQIATKPIKLEVYQGGKKASKIYYFGFATQDHYGNYALLEIPGEGKSKVPYIIKEKGFYGFIRPRMITMESEWRSPIIFDYPKLAVKNISMEYPAFPEQSFEIEWEGNNLITLKDGKGEKIDRFDSLAVKNYMLQYKAIYVETYNNRLNEAQRDSTINTQAKAIISVRDENGKTTRVKIYDKGFIDPFLRDEAYNNLDPERYYILNEANELAIAQKLQWDPLLVPLNGFNPE